MKYAILGDIHANLEALQAVLEHAKSQKVTHFACVGDIVGYGPNPKECLDIVRQMNCPIVKGNHDEYCASENHLEGFNPMAAEGIFWTRKQLTDDDKEYLRNLKYVRPVESFTIVHATLDMPQKWQYVFDKLAAAASFSYQTTQMCFNGHTHVPIAFIRASTITGGVYTKIQMKIGYKYFINVGSVGQPRDRDPRAAYVTFDLINNLVELHRVEYDVAATQKKIREAGLPESLAQRLALGR
jgi:predicted phosphodiesterase